MKMSQQPSIVQAAQEQTTLSAALKYATLGLSIIPLDGKRPALTTWTEYQQASVTGGHSSIEQYRTAEESTHGLLEQIHRSGEAVVESRQ